MINNLQANSLNIDSNSSYLLSNKFKIDSQITLGSIFKLDTKELKAVLVNGNKRVAKVIVFYKDGYFFYKLKPIESKDLKLKLKKEEALLKIKCPNRNLAGLYALSKGSISAILRLKKRYLVELYFNDGFYIEIKDIL